MKVLDLFSGIGGFSLGLERAGMETIAFCEFDKHAQKILKKHWPDVPIHEDVRLLDATKYRGSVDVVCGGFPCQDLSLAGRKAGISGERSGLYREMLRIISECLPRYAIFENVTGLLSGDGGRWFAQFLYDLAEIGFDAEWHCIPASYVGAPHHRDRVWIIAYSKKNGSCRASRKAGSEAEGQNWNKAEQSAKHGKIQFVAGKQSIFNNRKQPERKWRPEPSVCRVDNGVQNWMDRLERLGNSVVPQIPEMIGKAIMKVECKSFGS